MSQKTILDCSTLLPGPFIGKLFVQKGARVLKIESPERPDRARQMGTIYADLNENKELVLLDLADPMQRGQFNELVRRADGLIEGFRPATREKLGLDEATLHAINPRLCILSLVGYSEQGPRRDQAGHDLNFEAVTGMLSLFNEIPALPLAELFGAYEGAFSLACAMDRAREEGRGSRVVVSFVETLRNIQSRLVREYRATGLEPKPGTTLFSGLYPCYRIYRAADGRRIAVGALEPKFWQKVCDIIGVPELGREGYATGEWGQEVIQKVQACFASRPWSGMENAWDGLFRDADCCVEPVLDYSEAYGL